MKSWGSDRTPWVSGLEKGRLGTGEGGPPLLFNLSMDSLLDESWLGPLLPALALQRAKVTKTWGLGIWEFWTYVEHQ